MRTATRIGKLTAVIVNHRTPQLTLRAARAVLASSRPVDELIVVDNGSPDDALDALTAEIPTAVVVALPDNLGFAGGSNAGIRLALEQGADLVLLVNSDALLEPRCIEQLEHGLAGVPTAGIAGPTILTAGTPPRLESQGIRLDGRTGRMRLVGHGRAPRATPAPTEVDALSGCVMLLRRAVLEQVGLFEEQYFYAGEDIDLCLRARRAELGCICVTAAQAVHLGGGTIGHASPDRLYYGTRNHLLLLQRMAPSQVPIHAALRACNVVALSLAQAVLTGGVANVGAVLQGARDHLRRRYGPRPSIS